MKNYLMLSVISFVFFTSCVNNSVDKKTADWQSELEQQLPVLGHRNWILIVDKAFPAQNGEGIITINTGEKMLPVLKYTLNKLNQCEHVKPLIFIDKELDFITTTQVSGINMYRDSLRMEFKNTSIEVIKHDSVFGKIDKASKLFRIVVLKTEEVIPYSSVFIRLDCKYWNAEKQQQLELLIKKSESNLNQN